MNLHHSENPSLVSCCYVNTLTGNELFSFTIMLIETYAAVQFDIQKWAKHKG